MNKVTSVASGASAEGKASGERNGDDYDRKREEFGNTNRALF